MFGMFRRLSRIALLAAALAAILSVELLAEPPALKWVRGTITGMFVQPKVNYYTFTLRHTNGTTTLVQLCDPDTGAVAPVKADDPLYDVLRESFFRGGKMQVGVRDFGHDQQSGGEKICADRVSLYK
jgi:hypothetical protein